MSDSSYIVARRFGLTASQHFALRLIGGYVEAAVLSSEVSILTLRSLRRRRLIKRRVGEDPAFVGKSVEWFEFELTDDGRRLAEELGPWKP